MNLIQKRARVLRRIGWFFLVVTALMGSFGVLQYLFAGVMVASGYAQPIQGPTGVFEVLDEVVKAMITAVAPVIFVFGMTYFIRLMRRWEEGLLFDFTSVALVRRIGQAMMLTSIEPYITSEGSLTIEFGPFTLFAGAFVVLIGWVLLVAQDAESELAEVV